MFIYFCPLHLFFVVNIWSHLLGAIAFIIIAPISYFKYVEELDSIRWTDLAVLYAFLAGAIFCLSMSASFHTFCCHSEKVSVQKKYNIVFKNVDVDMLKMLMFICLSVVF